MELIIQIATILLAIIVIQSLQRPKFVIVGFSIIALVYLPGSWIAGIKEDKSSQHEKYSQPQKATSITVFPRTPVAKIEYSSRGSHTNVEPPFESIRNIDSIQSPVIGEMVLTTTVTATSSQQMFELPLMTPLQDNGASVFPTTELAAGEASFSFFGINEESEGPIIIVVDLSPSMEGAKRRRLTEELIASISNLPEYAQFQVVFYAAEFKWFNGSDAYQTRNSHTIEDLQKAAMEMKLGGSTLDRAPLSAAVARRPSAIYFHTDGEGEFHRDPALLNDLLNINQEGGNPCRIHCVEFGDQPNQHPILKDIATRSGGKYRFIEVH